MSDGPWQAIPYTPGDQQPLISDGVYRLLAPHGTPIPDHRQRVMQIRRVA
jgi:hypothetical protein